MSGTELLAKIASFDLTVSDFCRLMHALGDHRTHYNIQRNVLRMIIGEARVSGEMAALVGLMDICYRRGTMPSFEKPSVPAPLEAV